MDVLDDRNAAWSAVFRVIPAGWKVTRSAYSSSTGSWSVTAMDPGEGGIGDERVTTCGRTEAEAARRLAALLLVRTHAE